MRWDSASPSNLLARFSRRLCSSQLRSEGPALASVVAKRFFSGAFFFFKLFKLLSDVSSQPKAHNGTFKVRCTYLVSSTLSQSVVLIVPF